MKRLIIALSILLALTACQKTTELPIELPTQEATTIPIETPISTPTPTRTPLPTPSPIPAQEFSPEEQRAADDLFGLNEVLVNIEVVYVGLCQTEIEEVPGFLQVNSICVVADYSSEESSTFDEIETFTFGVREMASVANLSGRDENQYLYVIQTVVVPETYKGSPMPPELVGKTIIVGAFRILLGEAALSGGFEQGRVSGTIVAPDWATR